MLQNELTSHTITVSSLSFDSYSFSFLQYFVEAGAIAVRRVRKEDMRHVAKATGATLVICQLCFYIEHVSLLLMIVKHLLITWY